MKRFLIAGCVIAASVGGALGPAGQAAAQTPDNQVVVSAGSARCTSPLDGTWTASWLVDASSATSGNTWVLTSPDSAVVASPSAPNTTLVSGYLELVTTDASVSVEWDATFDVGNDVSGTTSTLERPVDGCEPPPPTDGFEYTLACSVFEDARTLVVNWQEGVVTGTETIPLASGTVDPDTGEIVGGQYPPDDVEVTVSTPTGTLSFTVAIPDDPTCGPTRTVVTTTTTTTTVAETTTTVAETTTTTTADVAAQTTTTVATPASTLPETGNEITSRLAMSALILLGLGVAAVGVTRRRPA